MKHILYAVAFLILLSGCKKNPSTRAAGRYIGSGSCSIAGNTSTGAGDTIIVKYEDDNTISIDGSSLAYSGDNVFRTSGGTNTETASFDGSFNHLEYSRQYGLGGGCSFTGNRK